MENKHTDPQLVFYCTEVVKWHNALCNPQYSLDNAKRKFSNAWGKFEKRCYYLNLVPLLTFTEICQVNEKQNGFNMSFTNKRVM